MILTQDGQSYCPVGNSQCHIFYLQLCVRVQQLMKTGAFGSCTEAVTDYEQRCHKLFPLATAFKPLEIPVQLVENEIEQSEGDIDNPDSNSQKQGEIIRDECSGEQNSP